MKIPRPTQSTNFEYGAIRKAGGTDALEGEDAGSEWIWNVPGGNGTFTVAPDAYNVFPQGMAFTPFGNVDFRLTIDSTVVRTFDGTDPDTDPNFGSYDPANGMRVKSSSWGWSEVDMTRQGDDFVLTYGTDIVGTPAFKHNGLLSSGTEAQFVFVLGGSNSEYKDGPEGAITAGVTAEVKVGSGDWMPATINIVGGDKNTAITAP
ncbi:MAG: hypothetical protein HC923_11190 [Myxococcales bacterium]|nr:hypothetical protein [Myxococcales bacterium]